ncbi:MAG: hypothetical protein R2769_01775 [Saprospiraceae bacterium]
MSEKPHKQEIYDAILKTYVSDVQHKIQKNASDAIASFTEGETFKEHF